jgi:hypothetical protein
LIDLAVAVETTVHSDLYLSFDASRLDAYSVGVDYFARSDDLEHGLVGDVRIRTVIVTQLLSLMMGSVLFLRRYTATAHRGV